MLLHTEDIQMRKEHEIIFNIPLATREMKLKQEWGITTWLLECFKKLLTSANEGENVNKLDHSTFSIINATEYVKWSSHSGEQHDLFL